MYLALDALENLYTYIFHFMYFVLQGKFSDTITNEKKKEAWGRVTEPVNTGERKTADQVLISWKKLPLHKK